jgi:SHC-transforming protein 1
MTTESEKTFDYCFIEGTSVECAIMNEGVNFYVKYIGCVEIVTSMKLLDFQSRSQVAKECIHRVCETANVKSPKKRKTEKRVQQCISDNPCMEHSGTDVVLNISSHCLELTSIETGECIANHSMPNISFASGGDSESMTLVAYVAKSYVDGWRACYVLECGIDQAPTVISTMGQAFELRYKNFCGDESEKNTLTRKQSSSTSNVSSAKCDTEYYNDLPGKMPPEFSDSTSNTSDRRRERLPSNLIDLNTSIDYVNDESRQFSDGNVASSLSSRDVFDMQCFSLSPEVQHSQLLLENWYHGPINRIVSESLLKTDGDFLVRESQGSQGQYVLTGLNAGQPKHLLLISPDGCVRTKDRIFDSISHLINYHWSNRLPIISADSALLLRTPVIRTTDLRI